MDDSKTIIRKAKNKDNPYVMVAKTAIQDESLSWKATGLLSYLLSLPDDWTIYVSELTKHKTNGLRSTRSALNELITTGYIEHIVTRDIKGRYSEHAYIVHEIPKNTQKDEQKQPDYPFRQVDNGNLLSTDNIEHGNVTDLDAELVLLDKRQEEAEHWEEEEMTGYGTTPL